MITPASEASVDWRAIDSVSVHILIGREADPLEQKAANELRRYLRLLFGCGATLCSEWPKAGLVFRVGVGASGDLGLQDYAIRPRRDGGLDICELLGGSPVAVLWAVYDLVNLWGVEYLTRGDVLPSSESVGPLRLPTTEQVRKPVFKTRAFRVVNDMVCSGVLWSLADYEKLFDQLTKLRFNTVQIATFPHQPWAHWSFRGVQRQEADLIYGFRHVIHDRSIGKELFGQLGHYTNPDLRGCDNYEDRLEAGKRFMHGLMAAAHRRGLQCVYGHCLTDVPEDIKRQLPKWSDATLFPRRKPDASSPSCIGIEMDQSHDRYGYLMTPRNPVYVEMVESWLAANLEEYPEIDGLFLYQSEFPAGITDYQHCWNELDHRYGLAKHFDLKAILQQASDLEFYVPGRALREAKGAIATIRMLDMVLNERSQIRDRLPSSSKIYSTFLSEFLMPVLPHVFDPQRFEFVALPDYLPQRVADRMDGLAFVKDSPLPFHLITTLTDDNVGFLPQWTAPSLHRSIQKMREYGVSGYWFRQFSISKVELTMAYMADAGWDSQASPKSSFERQIERICGAAAVEPMLQAASQLEQATLEIDKTIGLAFEMPILIRKLWEPGHGEPYKIETLQKVGRELAQALPSLRAARDCSQSRGRSYVDNMVQHVEFGCQYFDMVCEVLSARQCQQCVEQEEAKSPDQIDIERLYDLKHETARRLGQALEQLEQATRTWVQTVIDPTDLGTLLGLNVYGLDYLRGEADKFRLKAEFWGFSIT